MSRRYAPGEVAKVLGPMTRRCLNGAFTFSPTLSVVVMMMILPIQTHRIQKELASNRYIIFARSIYPMVWYSSTNQNGVVDLSASALFLHGLASLEE